MNSQNLIQYWIINFFLPFCHSGIWFHVPLPQVSPEGPFVEFKSLKAGESFKSFWLARQGYLVARAMVKDPR